MANRVREDEKNERIIRGLLKLPENRRCINCNSLGPQYVCTNFWTFVCTTCSGIHREFTHRVKSVSMAKFTGQEVTALQEGGNKRARDIYFKEWDSQHQTAPDSSNVERLRDFIKHAYVDRRFSGEKNYGKPPSVKLGDKEEFNENRRYDSYQRGSRSPSYYDTYERRYSEGSSPGGRNDDKGYRNNYDERRSPGYDQESRQYNDYRRSPGRPEIINDWPRENRFGNGGKVEDNRVSDGDSKLEGRSPERLKEPGATSPPIVRPVREILGDNVMPLRIIEPPKANVSRTTVGSAQTQRTTSSSSLGSNNGNPVEVKVENSRSLIDFDAEPEPPVTAAVQQVRQTTVPQSTAQPSSTSNDSNWASFDFAPEVKVSQAPSSANPIDSVISQLTAPPSVPGQLSGIANSSGAPVVASAGNTAIFPMTGSSPVALVGNSSALPFNVGAPATALVGGLSTFNPSGVSVAAPGLAPTMPVHTGNSFGKVTEAGQWLNVQHQQSSLFSAPSGQPTAQQFLGNQTHNFSPAPNMQVAFGTSGGAPSVVPNTPPVGSAGVTQPSFVETKPIGRKELPADLFTATYSSFPVVHPGWQTGPVHGMGFPVQYNNAVLPMQTFVQSAKSTNPFDLSETAAVQNQTFPSMASLQGALPNLPLFSGIQHAPSPAWMPSQSLPYQSALLPSQQQQPTYASAVPPRAYMTQAPGGMPLPGHQGIGTFGNEGSGFSAVNMDQQMVSRFSAPATPQPFPSVGGNPFG